MERKKLSPGIKNALPSDPPPPPKPGRGRPRVYRDGYDTLVYKLRLAGLTVEKIADILEVTVETLYAWKRDFTLFSEAWDRGGEQADGEVAKALYHRAIGYSHPAEKIQFGRDGEELRADYVEHYPPDTAAAMFWLTNRRKNEWKRSTHVEATGPDGQPLAGMLPPIINIVGVAPTSTDDG